jgi:hypothetical protein
MPHQMARTTSGSSIGGTELDASAARPPRLPGFLMGVGLGGPLAWDVGFLVFGAALVVGGSLLVRSGDRSLGVRPSGRGS